MKFKTCFYFYAQLFFNDIYIYMEKKHNSTIKQAYNTEKTLKLINNECTRDSSCLVMTLDHKVTHTFFSFIAPSPAESCVFLHRGSWRCFVGGSVCWGGEPGVISFFNLRHQTARMQPLDFRERERERDSLMIGALHR